MLTVLEQACLLAWISKQRPRHTVDGAHPGAGRWDSLGTNKHPRVFPLPPRNRVRARLPSAKSPSLGWGCGNGHVGAFPFPINISCGSEMPAPRTHRVQPNVLRHDLSTLPTASLPLKLYVQKGFLELSNESNGICKQGTQPRGCTT